MLEIASFATVGLDRIAFFEKENIITRDAHRFVVNVTSPLIGGW